MEDELNFQLRYRCNYEGEDFEVRDLIVEQLKEGEWVPFDLGFDTTGFLIFVYAVLNCQHQFLRRTAGIRKLQVTSSEGYIDLTTDVRCVMQSLRTRFRVRLARGVPTADDADFILGELQDCPVSTNLSDIVNSGTVLEFELQDDGPHDHEQAA